MKRLAIIILCLFAITSFGRVFVDGLQARRIQASWKDAYTNANILAAWGPASAGTASRWQELNGNDAWSTTGVSVIGDVYSFYGSVGEEFRTNMAAMADLNNDFTIMAWVKSDELPVDVNGVIGCLSPGDSAGWQLEERIGQVVGIPANCYDFHVMRADLTRGIWYSPLNSLVTGTWTHVAVVVTNAESTSIGVHFVIDGNDVATGDWAGAPNNVAINWASESHFNIGWTEQYNEYWDGNIVTPVVVGRALTTNEIQNFMSKGDPR